MKHRHSYFFDADAFLRFLILLGFMCLLIWLVNTNQLTMYINPKFTGLIEISGYLLFLLCMAQALNILRPALVHGHQAHHHTGRLLYVPFFALLALAFLLPNNSLDANLVNMKGLNSQLNGPAANYQMSRPLAAKLRQASLITVTDSDYTEIMNELQFFSPDYLGKEITMTGFVFRPAGVAQNQFSLVRYVIVCCTADALPYGALCEHKEAAQYKDGTWLSIRGVIQEKKTADKIEPVIKITSCQQVPEPKNPYVFPPSE